MRITSIETIHLARGITVHAGPVQWLWVRIHTDSGLVGLGETYPHPEAEKAVVQRSLAPVLLGRDPLQIDRLWADMFQTIAYSGWAGAEMRAISAVDMALWDLAGKAAGMPVYQLLGGASRDSIRTYNTCYDHIDFLTEPVRLARELANSGVYAMKIWPFDGIAKETGGQYITADQMRRGMEPLRLIKEEFGDTMDVAMEFHGYWNLPCAIKIAQALEPYKPMWLEEMLPQDNLAAYRELASATPLPLCLSERLMTRWGFRELLENRAARIIMPDICWCGGISEAKKIASMAEAHYLPVAPHNCGGPVLHVASAHLAANLTNLCILESVRRHYLDEYRGLVTTTLPVANGVVPLPEGPGLGVELTPQVFARPDVTVERINA
ncbi:MAG: mandelate racemase/muconate lactonizing enzyme family protein [Candidatus Solibacter usitatus]|nr:mandelate racemase/muconate lactonizing enzyme family protein [Candidatus Solibacter usitatus]